MCHTANSLLQVWSLPSPFECRTVLLLLLAGNFCDSWMGEQSRKRLRQHQFGPRHLLKATIGAILNLDLL